VIVCAAAAWRSRNWLPVATVAIGLAGFALAVTVVKLEVARPRPPLPYAVMAVDGYSFPSGHALGVVTATLISAWTIAHWLNHSWNGQLAVWTSAIAIIGGVGLSRIYLAVHYPSDVIAGWLLGAIWAGALLTWAGLWGVFAVPGDQQRDPHTMPERWCAGARSATPSIELQVGCPRSRRR
jgi:membrane-associated phospholipid phosphatase